MWFSISFSSPVPIYVQIVDKLKTLINSGQIKPGEYLPSVRALAQSLGVNMHTVLKAYKVLESEGIVKVERGEGYMVVKTDEKAQREVLDELSKLILKAQMLNVKKSEIISLINKLRLVTLKRQVIYK